VLIGADRRRVLVGERIRKPGSWQLPQGGIEKDEEPGEAAARELYEELGVETKRIVPLFSLPVNPRCRYELDASYRARYGYVGQEYHFTVFQLRDPTEDNPKTICDLSGMNGEPPEFRDCKWMDLDELIKIVWEKRRPAYEYLRECVRDYFRDPDSAHT